MVIAAAACACAACAAAAVAAVYAWHRLRGPVPLVAWAFRLCARPRQDDAAKLEDALSSLKVPNNGVVQVMRTCPPGYPRQCMPCTPSHLSCVIVCDGYIWHAVLGSASDKPVLSDSLMHHHCYVLQLNSMLVSSHHKVARHNRRVLV